MKISVFVPKSSAIAGLSLERIVIRHIMLILSVINMLAYLILSTSDNNAGFAGLAKLTGIHTLLMVPIILGWYWASGCSPKKLFGGVR